MASVAPPGLLMFTALPGDWVQGSNPAMVRLSVLLTPRLVGAAGVNTIADFTAGSGGSLPTMLWATGQPGDVRFDITFRASGTVFPDVAPLAPIQPFDPTLWAALLPGTTLLGDPPSGSGYTDPAITSYSVSGTYGTVAGGLQPPPPNGDTGTNARARLITILQEVAANREAIRAHLAELRATHPTLTRRHLAASTKFSPDVLAFADMQDYYAAMSAGSQARWQANGGTTQVGPLDVHSAFTAFLRYPVLLRALGLLLDLEIPAAGIAPNDVVLAQPRAATLGAGWTICTPNSTCVLDPTGPWFLAAGANPALLPGIAQGLLEFPLDAVQPLGFDLDAVVHAPPPGGPVLQVARPKRNGPATTATTAALPLAAPRSNGLGLAKDELATDLSNVLSAQSSLEAQLAQDPGGSSITLAAEHTLRGFRVDIKSDQDPTWRSLCARTCTYTIPGWTGTLSSDQDEGFVQLRVFNPTATQEALWTHEALFQWQGWSLSAPRPGLAVAQDGSTFDPDDPGAGLGSNLNLQAVIRAVPGTLPRLRFGATYSCRLRMVDAGGTSIAFDDPRALNYEGIPLGMYLRYDPIIAPVLVESRAPGPGESLEQIVIRCTDVTSPTTDVAERLLAPPKTNAQMVEWHGMFDTATGLDPNAYATLIAFDGNFSQTPYGTTPPALPYLPDPLARRVAFVPPAILAAESDLGDAPPADYQAAFGGTWPAITPIRLQLIEGTTQSWNFDGEVLTLAIPKGARVSFDLASVPNQTADGTPNPDLAILAAYANATAGTRRYYETWIPGGYLAEVTPSRTLTFVHAVQQPVIAPQAVDQYGQPTPLGCWRVHTYDTSAQFGPYFLLDPLGTGRLEILAEWDDPVDNGIDPPSTKHVSMRAWADDIDLNDSRYLLGDNGPTPYFNGAVASMEFHDTKHHHVTYTLVAISRYAEYFPAEVTANSANITQASAPYVVDVVSVAEPPPPKVLAVVPLFNWSDSSDDQNTQRMRTSGVRVYLDRPWYVTGVNEMLGVAISVTETDTNPPPPTPTPPHPPHPPTPPPTPTPHPTPFAGTTVPEDSGIVLGPPASMPPSSAPFYTQWGNDPVYAANPISSAFTPLPQHFLNPAFTLEDTYVVGSPPGYKVYVLYNVSFQPPNFADPTASANPTQDPNNGCWYADITMDSGVCAAPFVRLALVRLQTNADLSIANQFYTSQPVLTDFVQLSEQRVANVTAVPDSTTSVDLLLWGYSSASNAASDSTGRPPRWVIATVEADANGGTGAVPLWIAFQEQTLTLLANSPPMMPSWTATLTLPADRGSVPMRVVLREFETLPSDPATGSPAATSFANARLVYADFVSL